MNKVVGELVVSLVLWSIASFLLLAALAGSAGVCLLAIKFAVSAFGGI